MQSNLNVPFLNRFLPLILLLGSFAAVSCKSESGPVGGSIVPPSDVVYDTLLVNGFTAQALDGYSGKLTYFPIGSYDDALFGEYTSTAYLKPAITGFNLDTTLDAGYTMYLELVLDSAFVYGNKAADSEFTVYTVQESWRGNEFRLSDKPLYDTSNPVATFTVSDSDSMRIELSEDWKDAFNEIYSDTSATRDSTYLYEFNGLAVVPSGGSAKISFPDVNRSSFILLNSAEEDTATVGIGDWAYSMEHNNAPQFPNHYLFENTLASFYKLDLSPALDTLTARNLIRAELVLYEDTEKLQDTGTLPAGHTRVKASEMAVYNGYTRDLEYDLFFSEPTARGAFDNITNSYRFNITPYVNTYIFSTPKTNDLYLDMRPAGGLLRNTLIFGDTAPDSLKPKLILLTAK